MVKKLNVLNNKKVLGAVVVIALLGTASVLAYKAGQKNATTTINSSNAAVPFGDIKDAPPGVPTQNVQFEEYKKQIEDDSIKDEQKTTIYINAAFAGAAINAPEAAEYAKQALSRIPDISKNRPENKAMIDGLKKISEGKYNEAQVNG